MSANGPGGTERWGEGSPDSRARDNEPSGSRTSATESTSDHLGDNRTSGTRTSANGPTGNGDSANRPSGHGSSDDGLTDGVVRLRAWEDEDAAWYAESVRDPEIQRFTTDPPTLDAAQVLAAIQRMRASAREAAFLICDAVTGERLGSIALSHDGRTGEVSYWVAAEARGRGAASRALTLFTGWIPHGVGPVRPWLKAHRDNAASQAVALRAGYVRDPDHDTDVTVKGTVWPMRAFVLAPPAPAREPALPGGRLVG